VWERLSGKVRPQHAATQATQTTHCPREAARTASDAFDLASSASSILLLKSSALSLLFAAVGTAADFGFGLEASVAALALMIFFASRARAAIS